MGNLGNTWIFQQALEKTQANIKWMRRYYSAIEKWLDETLQEAKGTSYRLPRTLIPSVYTVELFPDIYAENPENFTFSGSVTIEIFCNENTDNLTLNSRQLSLLENSVEISSSDRNVADPQFLSLSYNKDWQLVTFITKNQFIKGHNYSIMMNFTGPLLDDLQGLYYSSYKEGSATRYSLNYD